MGFKRIHFSEEFIYTSVKETWDDVRSLIFNNLLKDIKSTCKDGSYIYNKTGVIKSAPNFPKSKNYNVFLRGTSSNSTFKPIEINGVKMYRQNFWIKGTVINETLNNHDFL